MKKILLFASLLIFSSIKNKAFSQETEFKVKRSGSSFTYNGKRITPEALLPFIPGMESDDTIRPWIINLKDSIFKREVKLDTNNLNTGWASCEIDYDSFQPGYIAYKVIGRTKQGDFVLLVYQNGGGTLTFPYVYIVKLEGDKIIRTGNFSAEPLYQYPDEPIEIRGNEIINGKIHYTIPK